MSEEHPDDGATYELVESFDIDDGSLAGISPEMCFVLGVEWQVVTNLMRINRTSTLVWFRELVHAQNVERLTKAANRQGWIASAMNANDEGWRDMRFARQARHGEESARG